MSFEGIWWHIGEYCVNLIVLRIVLKKKKDSLVFLKRGTGRRLEYSGILWNPAALCCTRKSRHGGVEKD